MEPGDTALDAGTRRRVAIRDGSTSFEIAAPVDMTMHAVLTRIGIDRADLRDRAGVPVDPRRTLRDCADGDVFTVIDDAARPASRRRARRAGGGDLRSGAAVTALGAFALVIIGLTPVVSGISAPLTTVLGLVVAAGAVAVGVVAVRRAPTAEPAAGGRAGESADGTGRLGGAHAALALMFAAVLLVAPGLAWGTVFVAMIGALSAVAVLAAVLALVAASPISSGALGALSGTAAVLAGVWLLVLVSGLPPVAACAVTLGSAPVALRILPPILVTARPGMFIDFARFQMLRWSARQREPEPAQAVSAAQAAAMVARSDAQWRAGTAMVCLAAAVSAPFALIPLHTDDVLTLVGQAVLAVCAALALMLRSGRNPRGLLRWMPGAAAVVVVGTGGIALLDVVGRELLGPVALVVLAAAVIVAAVIVPIGRGMRSLSWSRVGDRIDAVAVAFALPAGLVAAGLIPLVRGVMS
ncbi:hypothetical protein [Microbacterium sp.]|uniref:hypothetical protein n=1 Tax=Microbacterium sp. TaxID=51671 RepID=UPI003A941E3F